MDPHLRVALLGLCCLAAVGCKKHTKPAPDPSIEEARVSLLRAAFAHFTNAARPEESKNQPQGERPPSALTATRASDRTLASWSHFATAVAADLAQGRSTDSGSPPAAVTGTGPGSHAQPTDGARTTEGPVVVPTNATGERGRLETDVAAMAEHGAPEADQARTAAHGTPEAETVTTLSNVGPSASKLPRSATPLAREGFDGRQPHSQHVPPADDDLAETPRPAGEADAKAVTADLVKDRLQQAVPKPLSSASDPNAKQPPKEPAQERTFAERAASSAEYASFYGAGPGFTGVTAGTRGATGFGAGKGHTGEGAGSGYTGIGAGKGDTGLGAGSGYTGDGAGSGYTGTGAGSGYTGDGAGSGYTGIGAGSGYTGIGAGKSGSTGIGASRVASFGFAAQAESAGVTSGHRGATNGGAIRGYVFMFTPWGPVLLPVTAQ